MLTAKTVLGATKCIIPHKGLTSSGSVAAILPSLLLFWLGQHPACLLSSEGEAVLQFIRSSPPDLWYNRPYVTSSKHIRAYA